MSYESLCMNCMEDTGGSIRCPHCRFVNNILQKQPYLPHRTLLGGRYLIGNVRDSNGEGATYIAFDIERRAKVTVREFLPAEIAMRLSETNEVIPAAEHKKSYRLMLNEFLELWRKLARMRGLSSLVLVVDIIEENNTAYAVCEHTPGTLSLRDFLLRGVGYISWDEARIMLMPVLSTLATLHSAGIIHRGISPDTLYVTPDHKIRIAGFCIADVRNENPLITPERFDGYAPAEQYGIQAPSGPWTDIYAFAAVFYRVLIGTVPIKAPVRMQSDRMMIPAKFAEQIPAYVINALINALQIMPENRTRSVERFRAELTASLTDVMAADFERQEAEAENAAPQNERPAPQKKQSKPKTEAAQKSTRRTFLITTASVLAVCLFIFIILCFTVLKERIGFKDKDAEAKSTVAESVETVKVPDFKGKTYNAVISQKYDFNFVKKEEYSSEVKKGYIISQSISEGAKAPKGSKITLVVSLGTEKITLVDVTGQTYETASDLLTERGFKCERVSKGNDGSHVSGTVDGMDLELDKEYDKGETVILMVWDEPSGSAGEGE